MKYNLIGMDPSGFEFLCVQTLDIVQSELKSAFNGKEGEWGLLAGKMHFKLMQIIVLPSTFGLVNSKLFARTQCTNYHPSKCLLKYL